MRIQPLDPNVVKCLRSDIAFTSVSHCVEELVWNSIDAGANCIAVRLNLPYYKIQVIDNGNGIAFDQMDLVGERYATSKCHTLSDLHNLQYGGFRGEALSSLKEVSTNLMIESRASGCVETYCKIFTRGKSSKPTISITSRPSKGTTVTVFDFMYNRPVRKNGISEALDVEESRKLLQSIALMHPCISFSLQSESTGDICLQFKKCTSTFYAFMQLFGKEKAKNLKSVVYQIEDFKISGYISINCFSSKDYQFLYVNKRLVLKTKLNKLINMVLNKFLCGKQKLKTGILNPSPQSLSPTKNQNQYCAFVLNISCARDQYDTIFDRKRTMVEFLDWGKVLKLVENSVTNFLQKEQLVTDSPMEMCLTVPNSNSVVDNNNSVLNLGVDNFKNGLFSNAVKRQNYPSTVTEKSKCIDMSTNKNVFSEAHVIQSHINNSNSNDNYSFHNDFKKTNLNSNTGENSIKLPNSKNELEFANPNNSQKTFICLKNAPPSTSVLDNLKHGQRENIVSLSKNTGSSSEPSTLETFSQDFDISCRSVFPVQNPILLKAPVKSTLSLLEKESTNSNALQKLKEKYSFVPQKNKKCAMLKAKSESINHKIIGDNTTNYKQCAKIVEENVHEHSTFQVIQPIDLHQNSHCNKINSGIGQIKKLQPSTTLDKNDKRITSKYIFGEEKDLSPLKRFRRSNATKTKLTIPLTPDSQVGNLTNGFGNSGAQNISFPQINTNLEKEINLFDSSQVPYFKLSEQINQSENCTFQATMYNCNKLQNLSTILEDNESHTKSADVTSSKSFQKNSLSSFLDFNNSIFLRTLNVLENEPGSGVILTKDSKAKEENTSQLQGLHHGHISSANVAKTKTVENGGISSKTKNTSLLKNLSDNMIVLQTYSSAKNVQSEHPDSKLNLERNETELVSFNAERVPNARNSTNISIIQGSKNSSLHEPKNKETFAPFSTEFSSCFVPNISDSKETNKFLFPIKLPSDKSTNCSPISVESSPIMSSNLDDKTTHYNSKLFLDVACEFQNKRKISNSTSDLMHDNCNKISRNSTPLLLSKDFASSKHFSTLLYKKNDSKVNKLLPLQYVSVINRLENSSKCNSCFSKSDVILSSDVPINTVARHEHDLSLKSENLHDNASVHDHTSILHTHQESLMTFQDESKIYPRQDGTAIKDFSPSSEWSISPIVPLTSNQKNLNWHFEKNPKASLKPLNSESVLSKLDLEVLKPTSTNRVFCSSFKEKQEGFLSEGNINSPNVDLFIKSPDGVLTVNNVSDPLLIKADNKADSNLPTCTSPKSIEIQNHENLLFKKCTDDDKSDMNSFPGMLVPNKSDQRRWICQINEETKRPVYIDSYTGNSTHYLPEISLNEMKETVPKEFESNQGSGKKTHFFLSHDFSPFVSDETDSKEIASVDDEICDLQIDLDNFMEQKESKEWRRKWRYPLKEENSLEDIQDMFHKWENPMFDIPPEMNNIEDPKVPTCLPHMYILNSYRFTKNSLDSLKVIGQIDCKFIACIIQDFNENYKDKRLLVLFDQHAVHERVRLEEITEDLYDIQEDGKRIVKSMQITTPLNLSLKPEEVRLLRAFHIALQDIGLYLSFDDNSDVVNAYSLPSCLVDKDSNQLRKKSSDTIIIIEKIIKEWLSSIMQSRAVSFVLPKTLSAVLNAQACRGAVKFGDPLDLSQCEQLVDCLSRCNLPFQCAHGRPSIAPILDLNKIETLCKKKNPPKLWKLKRIIR